MPKDDQNLDEMPIYFEGDQEEFDSYPKEYKEHLEKAFAHAAGLGPDPGKYNGPPPRARTARERLLSDEITEADLQRAREEPLEDE